MQACGFSFPADGPIDQLVERLIADAERELRDVELTAKLDIDAEIDLSDLTWDLVEGIQKLQPFGEGNKRPVFVSRNLEVVSRDTVGATQKHVRCVLKSPTGLQSAKFIGFNKLSVAGALDELPLRIGSRVDVAYDIGVNEWNGRKDIQCKLIDLRPSD